MKLNTRFSLLFSVISFVTISVPIVLLMFFSKINQLNEFNRQVLQTNLSYSSIAAYTDGVLSRSCNKDKLYDDWITLTNTVLTNYNAMKDSPVISFLGEEMESEVESLTRVWSLVAPHLDKISEKYKEIQEIEVPNFTLSMMSSAGLTKAVERTKYDYELFELEYMLSALDTSASSLQYVKDSLDSLFARMTVLATNRIERMQITLNFFGILISISTSVIIFLIATISTKRIVSRIKILQGLSSKMSEKDFSMEVNTKAKDEVGELTIDLNATIHVLSDLFSSLKESALDAKNAGQTINNAAGETASATHEIRSNIESLNKQFDQLLSAVDRSLSSLSQMSEVVTGLVTTNIQQSNDISQSRVEIGHMTDAIDSIRKMSAEKAVSAEEIQQFVSDGDEKINLANGLMEDIANKLDEIAEFVTIIDAISDQTNILSMNAAIESAHAGEAGKGFGVVAEEIRNLAETTGENARRIKETVSSITAQVLRANDASDEASLAFSRVSDQSRDMLVALKEIASEIGTVDNRSKTVMQKTTSIYELSEQINTKYDALNEQQMSVSTEMTQMSNIFNESINGVKEIEIGANDIVDRMQHVSSLSNDSYRAMETVSKLLMDFKTLDDNE
jgi:methyl-accepting chemotaxis protein